MAGTSNAGDRDWEEEEAEIIPPYIFLLALSALSLFSLFFVFYYARRKDPNDVG